MATIKNQETHEHVTLLASHVFGRDSRSVDTRLEDPDISHIHASIRWEGNEWRIYDHSRNGTFVNGEHVSHDSMALDLKCKIRFGTSKRSTWAVVNLDSPQTMLVPLQSDQPAIEFQRLYVLPNVENPEISIYKTEADQWISETENGIKQLKDGDIISNENHSWQFFTAKMVDSTLGIGEYRHTTVEDIRFYFHASLDEEHIEAKVVHHGKTIDLGERVHHYLLLILARQRLDDHSQGIDKDNQGWTDIGLLSKMLGLDLTYINIQIFRARKQIEEALPDVFHIIQLIERRPGSIRLGFPYFQIEHGDKIESSL
jgi:pSer/pThr/pTyr-binding forkhead associated (FHA) protein